MRTLHQQIFKMMTCGLLAAAVSSCSPVFMDEIETEDESVTLNSNVKQVTFGMLPTMESMAGTRASTSTSAPEVLLVLDVQPDGSMDVYTRGTGTETDVSGNVGDPLSLSLKHGNHTLYFLASESQYAGFDDEELVVTWTNTLPLKSCWATKLTLNVGDDTPASQSVTMPIRVAQVQVIVNDPFDKNAKQMTVQLEDASWKFNLSTMCGMGKEDVSRTFSTASLAGYTGRGVSVYTFVPEGVTQMGTLTVKALNSDGEAYISHTMENVPVQQAYITKYCGNFFSYSSGFMLNWANSWTDNNKTY